MIERSFDIWLDALTLPPTTPSRASNSSGRSPRRPPRRCWTHLTSYVSGSCSSSSAARRSPAPADVPAGPSDRARADRGDARHGSLPTPTATPIDLLTTYAIAAADGLFIAKEIGGDSVDLLRLFELHARALYDILDPPDRLRRHGRRRPHDPRPRHRSGHRRLPRLRTAAQTRTPCAPVRDLIGPDDEALAYAVQRTLTEARLRDGRRVVGRKIGLTSPAVQRQLGVDQPDFGVLFDDMDCADGAESRSTGRLLQPKIEAEVAFVLARRPRRRRARPPPRSAPRSPTPSPALEIVDSRIADWDITFADTVADNASSGLFVLGADRVPPRRRSTRPTSR